MTSFKEFLFNESMHDKPMAAKGLLSYRIKGPYGYIMIGAKDNDDAWNEAQRSSKKIDKDHLEKWDEKKQKYIFIKEETILQEKKCSAPKNVRDEDFKNGANRVPFHSNNVMNMLRKYEDKGYSQDILKAWLKGWDIEKLK